MKILKKIFSFVMIILILFTGTMLFAKKSLFPIKYEAYIHSYCERFGVSRQLVLAMIKTESNWNETAVSPKDACGLLQLQPTTFNWLVEKLDEDDVQSINLYEAKYNLKYGIYYIGILLEKYGDTDTALAAYNAGPTNVSAWLDDSRYSADGLTITTTPYNETNNYIKKVSTYMGVYNHLY